MTVAKPCKDCVAEGITTVRKMATKPDGTLHPGPRCVTHHRAKRKQARKQAHARRTENTYGISGEVYWELHVAQGGYCAICRKARGVVRNLAVDHDHKLCDDHPPEQGCPRCIRGLLCSPCNTLIGRYGVEALRRAIDYLENPPARKML